MSFDDPLWPNLDAAPWTHEWRMGPKGYKTGARLHSEDSLDWDSAGFSVVSLFNVNTTSTNKYLSGSFVSGVRLYLMQTFSVSRRILRRLHLALFSLFSLFLLFVVISWGIFPKSHPVLRTLKLLHTLTNTISLCSIFSLKMLCYSQIKSIYQESYKWSLTNKLPFHCFCLILMPPFSP